MKIKISKSQWEAMGKKAGWIKYAQFGEEGGDEQRRKYNPDFDIKKNIQNEDHAVALVTQMLFESPEDVYTFLGFDKNEFVKRLADNTNKLVKSLLVGAPTSVVNAFNKSMSETKTYKQLVNLIQKVIATTNPDPSALKQLILPLIGVNGKQLLERLHTYGPLAMSEGKDIEEMITRDDKKGVQDAINSILDRYNAGEINKDQMKELMKEFAKYKPQLVVTANGLSAKWIKQ